MERPDVTLNQKLATLIAGVPLVVKFCSAIGLFVLSQEGKDALEDLVQWAVIFGGLLIGGDTLLRGARNLGGQAPPAGVIVHDTDPDLDEQEVEAALRDELGRDPTGEEVAALLEQGDYKAQPLGMDPDRQ